MSAETRDLTTLATWIAEQKRIAGNGNDWMLTVEEIRLLLDLAESTEAVELAWVAYDGWTTDMLEMSITTMMAKRDALTAYIAGIGVPHER